MKNLPRNTSLKPKVFTGYLHLPKFLLGNTIKSHYKIPCLMHKLTQYETFQLDEKIIDFSQI